MNFKSLLKFTLSGLLLTATATAYAEGEEPAVVKLSDAAGTTISWTKFANAINNPSSIPAGTVSAEVTKNYNDAVDAQKIAAENEAAATGAYETAQKNLTQWQARLSSIGNTKAPVEWLENAYTQADAFDKAFDKVLASEDYTDNTVKVWYIYQKEGRANTVTISYGENQPVNNFIASPTSEFEQVGETALYEALSEKSFSTLYIYVGADNYSSNNGRIKVSTFGGNFETLASNAKAALETMINSGDYDKNATEKADLTDKINALTVADNNGQTGLDKLAEESNTAKTVLTEANATLDTAKAAYDKAVEDANNNVLATYKNVTLVGDVIATVAINEYDGRISGGKHVITPVGISELFVYFNGILSNVAVNGTIVSQNGAAASYNNVAFWNGSTGAFRDVDNRRTEFGNFAQLGFAVREFFGVDFAAKTLTPLTDASKVYSLTVYQPNSTTQKYVQVNDTKFFGEDGNVYEIPTNMFAKSETYDLEEYDFANVFYDDNHCPKAVITDKEQFYCPVDLEVAKVTYARQFNEGMNSVCVPFELTYDNSNIEALCTYDKETTEKFWFKKVAESIPANTPVLLVAKNAFTLDLNNIVLKKTESQMIVDEGDTEDPSKCYGLLKKATREEFQGGASEAHKVYGLTNSANGTFSPAGATVNFTAFRLAIYSNNAQPTGQMAAPRRIGIVDEKGVEITDELTTGVESVNADASSLNITTGVGEINITSEADYGFVEIYSADGQVAAMADVTAGTTTVNVQSGIYIVMGKKVMVK